MLRYSAASSTRKTDFAIVIIVSIEYLRWRRPLRFIGPHSSATSKVARQNDVETPVTRLLRLQTRQTRDYISRRKLMANELARECVVAIWARSALSSSRHGR